MYIQPTFYCKHLWTKCRLSFKDRDSYKTLKMVQIAQKHVWLTILYLRMLKLSRTCWKIKRIISPYTLANYSRYIQIRQAVCFVTARPVVSLLLPSEVCGLWESEHHAALWRKVKGGLRANNTSVWARKQYFLRSIIHKQNTNLNNWKRVQEPGSQLAHSDEAVILALQLRITVCISILCYNLHPYITLHINILYCITHLHISLYRISGCCNKQYVSVLYYKKYLYITLYYTGVHHNKSEV